MNTLDHCTPDVMQVCRNGHVITDMLRTFPERSLGHCDRCGAPTLERCTTCGQELPGAVPVPGLVPVGLLRPPQFCSACGAAFPWSQRPAAAAAVPALTVLETMLRRLPRVIRELRTRHATRPPFAVNDIHDLEDLLRALLPLHFDDIRPENRTPKYAADTRTDFLLPVEGVALVLKRTSSELREAQLAAQWPEDVAYYRRGGKCRALLGFVLDGECRLPGPHALETAWSQLVEDDLAVRCVIAQ